MPQTGTLAARNAVGATKAQSHRLVAIGAIEDICNRRLPRRLWAHQQTAFLLRTERPFLNVLQEYLLWRTANVPNTTSQLRLVGEGVAQARLYTASGSGEQLTWVPGNLIALRGGSEAERLADLFSQATERRWGMGGDVTVRTEKLIAFYCSTPFGELCDAVKATHDALCVPGGRAVV